MRIERVQDIEVVERGSQLFDQAPDRAATERFLGSPTHHLLMAFGDDDRVLGMVTGVETTHPDKGAEMFLYELGVDEPARGQGVGAALVEALATLARERGCYGMWVGAEPDNIAAIATYRRAGAQEPEPFVTLTWDFDPAP